MVPIGHPTASQPKPPGHGATLNSTKGVRDPVPVKNQNVCTARAPRAQKIVTTKTKAPTKSTLHTNNRSKHLLQKHISILKKRPSLNPYYNKLQYPTSTNNTKVTKEATTPLPTAGIPTTIPVKEDIGKYGLMWPRGLAASHPASKMLEEFSTAGYPVDTGANWTKEQIIAAIKRGPISLLKIHAQRPISIKKQRKNSKDDILQR